MAGTTEWGFPKGKVAETLRKILAPDLTDHEVEAIVVCLVAHLMVESRLNNLLHGWLSQDAPRPSGDDERVAKAEDDLWKAIVKIDFVKKFSLVQPFFALRFREEAGAIWKINDLRIRWPTALGRDHGREAVPGRAIRRDATPQIRGNG
jgi:hypothetical protein